MTPDENSRQRRKDIGYSLNRVLFGRGLSLVRSVAVLPLVSPAAYGGYRFLTVLLGYASNLHFGTFGLLTAHYPRAIAEGRRAEAASLLAQCWWLLALGAICGSVLVFVLGMSAAIAAPAVLLTVSVLALANLPALYVGVAYRIQLNFIQAARIAAMAGALGLFGVFFGALFFGYPGFLIGATITTPIVVFLGRRVAVPDGLRSVRLREVFDTASRGALLWVLALATEAMRTADFMLLAYLTADRSMLGIYGLGGVLLTNITAVTNSITQVEAVYLSKEAGETSAPEHRGRSLLSAATRDGLIAMGVACLTLAAFAAIVPAVLPTYATSLAVAGPLLTMAIARRWRKYAVLLASMEDRLVSMFGSLALSAALLLGGFLWLSRRPDVHLASYAAWALLAELVGGMVALQLAMARIGCGSLCRRWTWRTLICVAPCTGLVLTGLLDLRWWHISCAALASGLLTFALHSVVFPREARETLLLFSDYTRSVARLFTRILGGRTPRDP